MGQKLENYREAVEEKVQQTGRLLGLSNTEIDGFIHELRDIDPDAGNRGRQRTPQGNRFVVELNRTTTVEVEFTNLAIREMGSAYPEDLGRMTEQLDALLQSQNLRRQDPGMIVHTADAAGYIRVHDTDDGGWTVSDIHRQ